MYDHSITQENLAKERPQVVLYPNTPNEQIHEFELQEIPINTVQQAIDHLNDKIKYKEYRSTCDKNKTKVVIELKDKKNPFTLDEMIFMENERIMSKWNYNYWAERYYRILNHENIEVLFKPNIIQRMNNKIYAKMNRERRAIKKWVVKARQVGDSTDSEGRILHRINYFSDAKSLIASKDNDSTDKMSQMFLFALDRLPFWNRCWRERYKSGEFYEFDINSLLDLGSGATTSVGRGRTPTICHISEAPFFKDPQKSLTEALFKAMHESIWLLQIVEGTAEVRGDWFHREWQDIIAGMEKGLTSWTGQFYPWYLRTDLYPTEEWVNARREAFNSFIPRTDTLAHAKKAEIWVRTHPLAREELGSNWKMSREQMFFYEVERDTAERKNELGRFLKEMPSDAEEAFQHPGHTMYPVRLILSMSDQAQGVEPEVYKLKGSPDEISPALWPTQDEIKRDGKKIEIKAKWSDSVPAAFYDLIQVNFNGWDNFDPINKILIWEHPKNGFDYGAGIDTSDGLGRNVSDNAVIEILRKGTVEFRDRQVCEFASPELPQSLLWPFVFAVSSYYSISRQLLLAPEINKGTELLTAMMNRGWWNVTKIFDSSRIGQDLTKIKKYGFETNNFTRNELINFMNSFIIGEWLEVYSMKLIEELKDIHKERKISAVGSVVRDKILGQVDDRFMATAMILYSLHRDELIGQQKRSWEERERNESSVGIKILAEKPSGYGEFDIDTDHRRLYNEEGNDDDWLSDDNLIAVEEDFY